MMSMILSDIAILSIKRAGYCCTISGISKSEAIYLMPKISNWKNIKHKFYYHM